VSQPTQTPVPQVFILIDTRIIGGPGRGLFHFLDSADHTTFGYSICAFRHRAPGSTEFLDACGARGYHLLVLDQRGRIDLSLLSRLEKAFRAQKGNILQTHGYKAHVLGYLLRKRLRVPWIAFSHGWTSENIKVRLYNALGRWCMKHADTIVAVSKPLADEAKALTRSADKVMYLPNAIGLQTLPPLSGRDELRSSLRIPCSSLVVGCLGRLSPEKGQDILIRAVGALVDKTVHLLIVGEGPERDALTQLAHRAGLGDRVHFVGYQPLPTAYYDASDLIAIPSRSEGLPNVLLESMAYRKIVVATPVGEIPQVITSGHLGFLSASYRPQDFAVTLQEAISNTDNFPSIQGHAFQLIEASYDAKPRARRIVDLYNSLLA
jgi:glycosyltransferase involved in cell wall biosynthesis